MTNDADTDFLRSGGAFAGPLGEDLRAALQQQLGIADGALFGPYRIVRELGRGGMGTVFLAERADDAYRKQVAIKIGTQGGWSTHAERRFRDERQILAGLEQINIARLIDGGTSPSGWPFLVMEFVDGVPIDVYCDQRRLSITDRLRIFRDVCGAVQYAHQRLIVHRDIKPSNVLVTADGTPKLLDFGIAKLLAPDGGGADQTTTLERVFTPEYASPEQVTGQPVTTATDVYQLGILLYQLLTGRRPYRVTSTLPHEIAAAICEQEPQRPSAAIRRSETGSPASVSASLSAEDVSLVREGTPERLRRRLHGDLDAIILTALRKAPGQRYGSAEQLSDDIGRHLAGLPIAARADSRSYRVRRVLWRHRIAFGTAAVVLAALLTLLAVAMTQRARAEAEEARSRSLLYASNMNLAGQYWAASQVQRAVDLLDAHVPAPGAEDFRGFEWYYLWKATHAERRVFAGAMPPAALSPDGRMLATSDDADRPSLQVWDVGSGRRLFALAGHTDQVNTLEFSPDGAMLISAAEDATTRLWRLDTRAQVAVFSGHEGAVTSATFDPSGTRIATSGVDASTRVWDLQGTELAILRGHAQRVNAVAFSRDGSLVATGSADATVKLWDTASWKETALLHDRRPGFITALVFSPDGQYLATTGAQWGGIAVWDLRTRQLLPAINHTSPQFTAAFSPGGELLATGGHDRVVLVWNVRQQRMVNYIRGHGDAVDSVRFSADGRTLVSASREGTARLWDVDVQQAPRAYRPNAPRAVVFAPDGTRLAVGTDTGVALWDVALLREVAAFPLPASVVAVAYSPDGRQVAALDLTSTVHVLNAADGTSVAKLPGRRALDEVIQPAAIAFSSDGRRLAAVDGDHSVRLWNVDGWRETVIPGGDAAVHAVAFSRDGRLLATAGLDRTPRVHDLTQQRPPVQLSGHKRPVIWIGFTFDGKRLATTSFDGTVRFWNPSTGDVLSTLSVGGDLGAAAFTPDNSRLIVAGLGDPSLSVFDAVSNDLLLVLRGHGAPVSSVAISPDGTVVASSSNDGSMRLWRAATPAEIDKWKTEAAGIK